MVRDIGEGVCRLCLPGLHPQISFFFGLGLLGGNASPYRHSHSRTVRQDQPTPAEGSEGKKTLSRGTKSLEIVLGWSGDAERECPCVPLPQYLTWLRSRPLDSCLSSLSLPVSYLHPSSHFLSRVSCQQSVPVAAPPKSHHHSRK